MRNGLKAYSLTWHPDAELEKTVDGAIDDIVAAQQPDGYMDTYYIINGLEKRWTNLMDHHELYCAGHMIEAAVAYYQATGKRKLLDAVIRLVAHINSVLGAEEGKLHRYPGHPIIEMALMRLYEVTGDPMHKALAAYFINERGQSPLFFKEEMARNNNRCGWMDGPLGLSYYQADKPLREQKDAAGHAVRALYLYSGLADVARETGDESLAAGVSYALAGRCAQAHVYHRRRRDLRATARRSAMITICPTIPSMAKPARWRSRWRSLRGERRRWKRAANTPT